MKILRTVVVIFFLVISAVFGVYEYGLYRDKDESAPVITADEDEIVVSVNDDSSAYTRGLHAEDDIDGDVSDSIVVTSKSYFIKDTKFRVNYAAFDTHNNVGTYSRMVSFSDYTSPRFSISEPLRFVSNMDSFLENVTATDVIDGDISSQIKMITQNTSYATNDISNVPLTIQVTNSFGDIEEINVTASIETSTIYNKPAPALENYLLYTSLNTPVDYYTNITGIWSGGRSHSFEEDPRYGRENITVNDSAVDYGTPGIYTVTYTLATEAETIGTTTMYVVVGG